MIPKEHLAGSRKASSAWIMTERSISKHLSVRLSLDAIIDPTSIIVRFFSAEFGAPNPATGKGDNWLNILKDAEPVEGEKPGERFRYSSAVTQINHKGEST